MQNNLILDGMSKNDQDSHISFIDNLKGFLIILVVLGHVIQGYDIDHDNNIVFRYIYSFHMPLFMFISGFLNYKKTIKWNTIKLRFVQLIIPFFLWKIINTIVCTYDIREILGNLIRLVDDPESGLWFLWVLFFIILFVYLLQVLFEKVCSNKFDIILIIGVVILNISSFFIPNSLGFTGIAYYSVYFILGFFLRKYYILFFSMLNKTFVVIFLLWLVSAYFWDRRTVPKFCNSTDSIFLFYAYRYFVAICGILSFYLLFSKMKGNNTILSILGMNTLAIYSIHQSIPLISYNLKIMSGIHCGFFVIVLLTICVLAESYFISWLIKRNKILSYLLLGIRKLKYAKFQN